MVDEKLRIVIDALNKASDDLKTLQNDVKGVDEAIDDTSSSSKNFSETWAGVMVGVSSAISVFQQAGQAVQKMYGFMSEGAELLYVEDRFNNLTEAIGTTADALMTDLQLATRGLYSDAELMQSATNFMQLGLAKTHDEAVRLSAAASALGMNMNQLTLTLTNKTTMRFDAIGMSVDGFTEKVKALEAAGMSADDAFKEAFLQQAEEQIEKVGHAADSAIGDFKRFEAATGNITNTLKEMSAVMGGPLISDLADFTNALNNVTNSEADGFLSDASGLFWDVNEILNPVNRNMAIFTEIVEGLGEKSLPDMVVSLLDGNNALSWMSGFVDDAFLGMEMFSKLLGGMSAEEVIAWRDSINDAAGAQDNFNNNVIEGITHFGDLSGGFTEVEGAAGRAAAAMQTYNDKLLFSIASQNLTEDAAYELAVSMGLVDEKTQYANEQIKHWTDTLDTEGEDAELFKQLVAGLADQLDRIQSKNVNIHLQWTEAGQWSPAALGTIGLGGMGQGEGGLGSTTPTASGGAVRAGERRTWQEYGYRGERFIPSQDGFVLSRSDAKRIFSEAVRGGQGQGGGGGNTYNLTMPTTADPRDVRTAFAIMEAMGA